MNNKPKHLTLDNTNKKHILWNLNQLLSQYNVKKPSITIGLHLPNQKSQRQVKTSQTNLRINNINNINNKKIHTKINFQHFRTKSSLKNRNKFNNDKFLIENNLQNPQHKYNKSKFLEKNWNSSAVFGLGLQKSYKSQELFPNNLIKNQSLTFRQQSFSTKKYVNEDVAYQSTGSLQLRSYNSLKISNSPKNKKKQFLKKGSSLQKQIVINLLKNKIMKQHELNQIKQYDSRDILSMIKVYKGLDKINLNVKSQRNQKIQKITQKNTKIKPFSVKINEECPIKIISKVPKQLDGWQIDADYEIEEQKIQFQ